MNAWQAVNQDEDEDEVERLNLIKKIRCDLLSTWLETLRLVSEYMKGYGS